MTCARAIVVMIVLGFAFFCWLGVSVGNQGRQEILAGMCPKSIPPESPDIDMDGIRKVVIMTKAACDVAREVDKP